MVGVPVLVPGLVLLSVLVVELLVHQKELVEAPRKARQLGQMQ